MNLSYRWLFAYLIAAVVALTLVMAVEIHWHRKQYIPGIIDSKQLWSVQRDLVSTYGKDALVFVGASRTLYGVDMSYIRNNWPKYKPVMLAINGHYPLEMLGALAQDRAFTGTVLVDIDSRGLAAYNHSMQRSYIDYYQNIWSPSIKWHRLLLNYWQRYMIVSDPRFGMVGLMLQRWGLEDLPQRSNITTSADRNSALDFSKVDTSSLAKSFANGLKEDLLQHPPVSPYEWLNDLSHVAGWVAQIRARGGEVIFYTPPVVGEQFRLAEEAYPRKEYWDVFINEYDLKGLVAADMVQLATIVLPDESHMDRSTKTLYTKLLFEELFNRGYLQRSIERKRY